MTLLQHPVGSGLLHTPSQEYPPKPRVSGRKRKAACGEILQGEPQGHPDPPEWLQFRQHPLDSHLPPSQQSPTPIRSVDPQVPFWCDLCKLNCVTHHNLKIHIHGKKHKAKCDEPPSRKVRDEISPRARASQSRQQQQRPQIPTAPPPVWCDFCKVNCMNLQNLKRHLQGKKHKAKWDKRNLESRHNHLRSDYSNLQSAEFQATPVWCTLCKLNCLNSGNLKRHLQGKKHRAKWDEQPLQAYSSQQQQQQPIEIQLTTEPRAL